MQSLFLHSLVNGRIVSQQSEVVFFVRSFGCALFILRRMIPMKKTLVDLWNGNICPFSNESIHTEELQNLTDLLSKYHSELAKKLDSNSSTLLQKMEDTFSDFLNLEAENAFVQGFSLAVKILTEARE